MSKIKGGWILIGVGVGMNVGGQLLSRFGFITIDSPGWLAQLYSAAMP
ncbi:MAG: hypothetical protein JWQ02_1763, partial [Capsulimonas sp.]|nr:hypothetical protein [Capsulimonas sp.]